MAWERQKLLKNERIPSEEDFTNMVGSIRKDRDRALIALLYLTGGRVSEIVRDLKREDISFKEEGGRIIMLVDMANRKNPSRKRKTLPIPFDRLHEGLLINMVRNYINKFSPGQIIFPISKQRVWQITWMYGFNPHFIRDIRLSHLVIYKDFNEFLLSKFAGWSDSRPATHYIQLRWNDILDKM